MGGGQLCKQHPSIHLMYTTGLSVLSIDSTPLIIPYTLIIIIIIITVQDLYTANSIRTQRCKVMGLAHEVLQSKFWQCCSILIGCTQFNI